MEGFVVANIVGIVSEGLLFLEATRKEEERNEVLPASSLGAVRPGFCCRANTCPSQRDPFCFALSLPPASCYTLQPPRGKQVLNRLKAPLGFLTMHLDTSKEKLKVKQSKVPGRLLGAFPDQQGARVCTNDL